jgi:hypothetical protein
MIRVENAPGSPEVIHGESSLILPPHLASAKQELFDTHDAWVREGQYIPPADGELARKSHMVVYTAGPYAVRQALRDNVSLEGYVDNMVGGIDIPDLEQLVAARRNEQGSPYQVYSYLVDAVPRARLRTSDIAHYGPGVWRRKLGTLAAMQEAGLASDNNNGPNQMFAPDAIRVIDYTYNPNQSLVTKVRHTAEAIQLGGLLRVMATDGIEAMDAEMRSRRPLLEALRDVCDEAEQHDGMWRGATDAVHKLIDPSTSVRI